MPALDVLTSYGDICCWIEFVIGWNSPLSVVLGHVTAKPIFSHTVDIEEVNLWSSCQQSASVDSYHLKPMWLLYLRAKCGSNHQCILFHKDILVCLLLLFNEDVFVVFHIAVGLLTKVTYDRILKNRMCQQTAEQKLRVHQCDKNVNIKPNKWLHHRAGVQHQYWTTRVKLERWQQGTRQQQS